MDRLLFGDNQFFGVNHMSEDKARAQAIKFQEQEAIVQVLDSAYAEGINTFMCTTHEQMIGICDHFRAHPEKYADFKFFPCMPYAHKYANAVTEKGMLGAARDMLPNQSIVNSVLKAGSSMVRKDIDHVAGLLVDAEMKMFNGLSTPVVFLQNIVVDLLLGLGVNEAFKIFADYVKANYNAQPGFITMNLPRLATALDEVGVDSPVICANFNKIGFRMCGSIDEYRAHVEKYNIHFIAMSVFASGALAPKEALEWIAKERWVESVVFGASTPSNIRNSKETLLNADAQFA